ncbi:MAG: response regulator [Chthoniobacteraceae bacterium]
MTQRTTLDMHLIHLEDSAPDAELIAEIIRDEWPECRITHVGSQEQFESAVQQPDIDLILSDYTIPGYDALAALATARKHAPQTPFIFFSGTIGEERAIEALKAGATDYVLKDRPARIVPAIRKALFAIEQAAAQRKLEVQLLRSQRLESIGMLAGGIAHDLNNMLSPIVMSLDLLRDRLSDPGDLELLDMLSGSAEHGAELVRQILTFAQGGEGQRSPMQALRFIDGVVKLLQQTLPRTIEVRFNYAGEPWLIDADATQLKQVVLNLGINARDAMPLGGSLEIRVANVEVVGVPGSTDRRPGRHVRISVVDTGSGMPPEMLERIFDPFFTTKASGKGTGLGLSTVAGIVRSHDGFLDVESAVGEGTTFHIYLPACADTARRAESTSRRALPTGLGERLLLIDDDEAVRTVLALVLRSRGYQVRTASSGDEGLAIIRQLRMELDLVITDLMMSGHNGSEIITRMKAISPRLKIIALSGLRRGDESLDIAALESVEFLDKPVSAEELLTTLRRVLDAK